MWRREARAGCASTTRCSQLTAEGSKRAQHPRRRGNLPAGAARATSPQADTCTEAASPAGGLLIATGVRELTHAGVLAAGNGLVFARSLAFVRFACHAPFPLGMGCGGARRTGLDLD
jgi:hypothetical protein